MKKLVLFLGACAIIWSLLVPITKTEKVVTGTQGIYDVQQEGGDGIFNSHTKKTYLGTREVYGDKVSVDMDRTGLRTIAIAVGAGVLWYIVPERLEATKVGLEEESEDDETKEEGGNA